VPRRAAVRLWAGHRRALQLRAVGRLWVDHPRRVGVRLSAGLRLRVEAGQPLVQALELLRQRRRV